MIDLALLGAAVVLGWMLIALVREHHRHQLELHRVELAAVQRPRVRGCTCRHCHNLPALTNKESF